MSVKHLSDEQRHTARLKLATRATRLAQLATMAAPANIMRQEQELIAKALEELDPRPLNDTPVSTLAVVYSAYGSPERGDTFSVILCDNQADAEVILKQCQALGSPAWIVTLEGEGHARG